MLSIGIYEMYRRNKLYCQLTEPVADALSLPNCYHIVRNSHALNGLSKTKHPKQYCTHSHIHTANCVSICIENRYKNNFYGHCLSDFCMNTVHLFALIVQQSIQKCTYTRERSQIREFRTHLVCRDEFVVVCAWMACIDSHRLSCWINLSVCVWVCEMWKFKNHFRVCWNRHN